MDLIQLTNDKIGLSPKTTEFKTLLFLPKLRTR